MKLGNLGGRAQLIVNDLAFDVERASAGRFGPTLTAIYDRFDEFVRAVPTFALGEAQPFSVVDLGSPVPAPRQVFAVGLNYHGHAAEVLRKHEGLVSGCLGIEQDRPPLRDDAHGGSR